MRKLLGAALLVALLLWPSTLGSGASPPLDADSQTEQPQGQDPPLPLYRPGQLLIKFRPQTPPSDREKLLADHDLAVLEEILGLGVQRVAVPEGAEQLAMQLLAQNRLLAYAELDYAVHATIIPNDTFYGWQWGMGKIRAPEAWDETTGSSDLIIAIIDTGVDLNHPDLNDKLVPGWDFANDDNNPQDDHGHGTHVAGIAAAETNNNWGVAGVSWGARIMPIKVLDESGDGYYSDVARGVRYACNHGAKIINVSLGGSNPSSILEDALEQAYADGCLIVAAAGNSGENQLDYPARYPETIAVGATDSYDQRPDFSDYGPQLDLAAPGVDVYSTVWTPSSHTYSYKTGTSMSTPHVAGLAALVWSVCPGLTNAEVQETMEITAKDLGAAGWDPYYGHGRINAFQAVKNAGPAAVLAVDAQQMVFLADATMGPWNQMLLVGNDAPCGTLDWTAGETAAWLYLDPEGGEASCSEPGEISVSVSTSGLTQGTTYNSTITVASTTLGVQGSPQLVGVKFVYSDPPLLRTVFPLGMSHRE